MRAEEVKQDSARKKAATAQLAKLVKDKEKEAKTAKTVAASLKKKPITKKKTSNRRKK